MKISQQFIKIIIAYDNLFSQRYKVDRFFTFKTRIFIIQKKILFKNAKFIDNNLDINGKSKSWNKRRGCNWEEARS